MSERRAPAGDVDYDSHGPGYSTVRRPDPRIAALIRTALGSAATVINGGAGAGSYEPADLVVTAVEPSASMRAQRPSNLSPAVDAVAESLPFETDSFDAAMAVVTIHQWTDPLAGLRELRRVARGPVVVLTFDPAALDGLWLYSYVPELMTAESRRFPPIASITSALGGAFTVAPVPVPIDCADGFADAFYARPEAFLDPAVRAAQSAWSFVDPDAVTVGVERLRSDLRSGEWDRRYGYLRSQPEFAGAVRLIIGLP